MDEYYVFQSLFISQLSLVVGCTASSWSSPMLPKLLNLTDNPLGRKITTTEHSWLASLAILGACCGSVVYGTLSKQIGRKPLMISMGVISMTFYLIMAWADNVETFYLCRFATGIPMGAACTVVPLYTAELARPSIRGILSVSMATFINIGILISTSVAPFIPMFWFHIMVAVLAAIYILLMSFFTFESPHFLINKNYDKAERILKKVRGGRYEEKELIELKTELEDQKLLPPREIVKSDCFLKAFFMILGLNTFMNLTGIGNITNYTQTIFDMVGGKGAIPSTISTIIISTTQLIATIVMSIIADNYSRKTLLYISYFGVAFAEIILGTFFVMESKKLEIVESITWVPLLCLMLIVTLYNVGAGPMCFTMLGEVFPQESKGYASSFILVYHHLGLFLISILFDASVELLGMGYLYLIFASFCLLATIFVYMFVIETKGISLVEIQHILKGKFR